MLYFLLVVEKIQGCPKRRRFSKLKNIPYILNGDKEGKIIEIVCTYNMIFFVSYKTQYFFIILNVENYLFGVNMFASGDKYSHVKYHTSMHNYLNIFK